MSAIVEDRPGSVEVEEAESKHSAPAPRPRATAAEPGVWAERARKLAVWSSLQLVTAVVVLAAWHLLHSRVSDIPPPLEVFRAGYDLLKNPFYVASPNDMGIGWQVLYSLGRVSLGFLLAVVTGVPIGFSLGMWKSLNSATQPLISILRPVSPLAWLPLGLLVFQRSDPSAVFVIYITSVWPIILNTAAGVQAIPRDYLNVAAVLQLSWFDVMRRIYMPAALPNIVTGMRLSLSTAWMVIVAAEMLTGGIGIGFFVWDEWNNLNVNSIIMAIVIIGAVGICLEAMMNGVYRYLDYNRV